jgi:pimeloyl-ACP methyl ester carboxylesterase
LVLALVVALLAPAAGRAREATPAAPDGTPSAAGGDFAGLVDIGGRSLYLTCKGAGSPTVVLESGTGDTSAVWRKVEPEVAASTRVCRYDRAGLGRSDPPPPGVRTLDAVVDDLHALLTAAGVPGPYVLVGHSYGAQMALLYAGRHPADVVGLVLVDPTPTDYWDLLLALVPEQDRALVTDPQNHPEQIGLLASADLVRGVAVPAVPAVVLVAGLGFPWPGTWPAAELDAGVRRSVEALAGELKAPLVVAEGVGHTIHQARPELVVEAIRLVVEAVHDPGSWATPAAPAP